MEDFLEQDGALSATDTVAEAQQGADTGEQQADAGSLPQAQEAGQTENANIDDGSDWFVSEEAGDAPVQAAQTGAAMGDMDDAAHREPEQEAQPPQSDGTQADGGEAAQGDKPNDGSWVTLKYYGREVPVSVEEAKALAQKGMDYDKVRAERDAMASGETGQALELMHQFAKQSGMTLPQYYEFARTQVSEHQQAEAMQAARDLGMEESAAQEYVRMQHQLTEMQSAQRAQPMQPAAPTPEQERAMQAAQVQMRAQQEKQRLVEQMGELLAVRPGLTQLPEPVLKSMDAGMAPLAAYALYENEQLKARMKQLQQTQKNRAAPGSTVGYAASEKIDPFTAGFFSGE